MDALLGIARFAGGIITLNPMMMIGGMVDLFSSFKEPEKKEPIFKTENKYLRLDVIPWNFGTNFSEGTVIYLLNERTIDVNFWTKLFGGEGSSLPRGCYYLADFGIGFAEECLINRPYWNDEDIWEIIKIRYDTDTDLIYSKIRPTNVVYQPGWFENSIWDWWGSDKYPFDSPLTPTKAIGGSFFRWEGLVGDGDEYSEPPTVNADVGTYAPNYLWDEENKNLPAMFTRNKNANDAIYEVLGILYNVWF